MLWVCCVAVCFAHAQTYKEYVQHALEAMAEDSLDAAERQFREAMRTEPAQRSNAMLHYHLGRIQERKGRPEKAIECYTTGLNIAPHLLPLRLGRARVYMQLNNKEKALVDYCDVLDWKNDNQEALFMRAYIYTDHRLYRKAREDYETLLRLNPAHEEARIGLVLLNDKDNRPREAMEQINNMINAAPDHAILYAVRAGMEQQRKLYEAAEADFAQAISLDASNPDFLMSRASFYIETKRKKEARADLERALELGANAQEVASMLHELR